MNSTPSATPSRLASRLKLAGVLVLVLGLAGAGLVYWLGTRSADHSDDLSMLNYNQPQERQMEMLYGKQGRLIQELSDTLKQPATQAAIIAIFSIIVAVGCFYLARPSSAEDDRKP